MVSDMKKLLPSICALLIAVPAFAGTVMPPTNEPSRDAATHKNQQRITLGSGSVYQIPKGWFALQDVGPFLQLEQWDPQRLAWRTHSSLMPNIMAPLYSTGANYRMVNTVDTLVAVVDTCAGKGYSSGANIPTITQNASIPASARATVRLTIGGGITVALHAGDANSGFTREPTLVFDYSNQTPPYRVPQIEVKINTSTGAISGFGYSAGNDAGNQAGTYAWSGAGLNAATLTAKILPAPVDVGTAVVPRVDVAAAPDTDACSGATGVTAVEVIDHGSAIGDYDFLEAPPTFTDPTSAGTGISLSYAGNFYITGVYPGNRPRTTSDAWSANAFYTVNGATLVNGGAWGSVTSSSSSTPSVSRDWPLVFAYNGNLDDEVSRQRTAVGYATLTSGVISAVKLFGNGPGYQYRPWLGFASRFTNWTSPPVAVAKLGSGVDYFTITQVGGSPTSWDWANP